MKRWHRRLLGVVVGLVLGWTAAGWIDAGPRGYAEGASGDHAEQTHDPGSSHGPTAGEQLARHAELAWLPYVLGATVGLFIAAAVFGPWAMRFAGPWPASDGSTNPPDASAASDH